VFCVGQTFGLFCCSVVQCSVLVFSIAVPLLSLFLASFFSFSRTSRS
jgi:hypothetical protein